MAGDSQSTSASNSAVPLTNEPIKVSIIGLGSMGMAVVKCLALGPNLIKIHAWNRGDAKRKTLQEHKYFNVHVHQNAETAIAAGDIILTMIDDWNGTVKLLQEENIAVWKSKPYRKQKTLILFSTYSPTDLQQFHKTSSEIAKLVNVVGGAIVGVPQTICSPKAYILSSISGMDNVDPSDKLVLDTLGTHVQFTGSNGLASLANIALLQGITFGIVGYEMTQLLFQQYKVNEEFQQQYNTFATQIIPTYISMLVPLISKGITYVPASTFRNVMKLHLQFMEDIGIKNDTYLGAYVHYLNVLIDNESTGREVGPAKWIDYATIDYSSTTKTTTTAATSHSEDEL
jgi:3-hydroxyisobutyrate dehydrogenase-like beta-hydroxyacid dehydrogenase